MIIRSAIFLILSFSIYSVAAVLFLDDFSSPEPAKKGWEDYSNNATPGTFEFDQHMLHFPQNMTKSAWLMVGDEKWTGVRITMKLRARFPEGYGLMIIAGRGDMDKAKLDATYAGWVLSGEGGFKSMLVSVRTGQLTTLDSLTLNGQNFVLDVWHDIVVEVEVDKIKVLVDGTELQSGSGVLLPSGKLVIANGFGSEVWIKNLKVESF